MKNKLSKKIEGIKKRNLKIEEEGVVESISN